MGGQAIQSSQSQGFFNPHFPPLPALDLDAISPRPPTMSWSLGSLCPTGHSHQNQAVQKFLTAPTCAARAQAIRGYIDYRQAKDPDTLEIKLENFYQTIDAHPLGGARSRQSAEIQCALYQNDADPLLQQAVLRLSEVTSAPLNPNRAALSKLSLDCIFNALEFSLSGKDQENCYSHSNINALHNSQGFINLAMDADIQARLETLLQNYQVQQGDVQHPLRRKPRILGDTLHVVWCDERPTQYPISPRTALSRPAYASPFAQTPIARVHLSFAAPDQCVLSGPQHNIIFQTENGSTPFFNTQTPIDIGGMSESLYGWPLSEDHIQDVPLCKIKTVPIPKRGPEDHLYRSHLLVLHHESQVIQKCTEQKIPRIPKIIAQGQLGLQSAIAMELIAGKPLDLWMQEPRSNHERRKVLSSKSKLNIAQQIAKTLCLMLKPTNGDPAYIHLDFDLSQVMVHPNPPPNQHPNGASIKQASKVSATLTNLGLVVPQGTQFLAAGKPSCFAPELGSDENPTAQPTLVSWMFGVFLYELWFENYLVDNIWERKPKDRVLPSLRRYLKERNSGILTRLRNISKNQQIATPAKQTRHQRIILLIKSMLQFDPNERLSMEGCLVELNRLISQKN